MSRIARCGLALLALIPMIIMVGCGGSSSPAPISLSISPSSAQTIDQSQSVTILGMLSNDMSRQGISWRLTGPGSLSNSAGYSVVYTPPEARLTETQQVTVIASPIADQSKAASVSITVNPDPQIPPQKLASGFVGVPYNQTIAFTGGSAPFQWSIYNGPIDSGWYVGGYVPDGLRFDPNTGQISGTPTAAGTWFFEAILADAKGTLAFNGFLSIQIKPTVPTANPIPFINHFLVPSAVSPGSPDFTLRVGGAGFVPGATVHFNHTPLATTYLDSDTLTAVVPASEVAVAGTATVTVANPGPIRQSNAVYFHVASSRPVVSFSPAPASLTIRDSSSITSTDLNDDGKPDLAVGAVTRLHVLLGNGDGTFTQAAGSPHGPPSPPYSDLGSPYVGNIASGDFDNSGHLGLAVVEAQNMATVILLGHGDGTFAVSSAAFADSRGRPTSGVEAADFNADGNLDLAMANQISGVSPVVLGYGKGAFNVAGSLHTQGFPTGLAIGDFNGDGRLDAAVAGGGSSYYPNSGIAVSLGKGNGTFTLAGNSPLPLGTNLSAIATSDFNGDGLLDLAVTDSASNALMILLGNGDGTFGTASTIPVGNSPTSIVSEDFNSDGKIDLAITNAGDGTITLQLGNGDGTFIEASGSPYFVGRAGYQMVAMDFNGDGKLDLAVVGSTDGAVTILLQQ